MIPSRDDPFVDAHGYVVPPGLPGWHAFLAALDGVVATMAITIRADMAASGTTQALAMEVLSDDPVWRALRTANAHALFRL